jgi:hypothetical protein
MFLIGVRLCPEGPGFQPALFALGLWWRSHSWLRSFRPCLSPVASAPSHLLVARPRLTRSLPTATCLHPLPPAFNPCYLLPAKGPPPTTPAANAAQLAPSDGALGNDPLGRVTGQSETGLSRAACGPKLCVSGQGNLTTLSRAKPAACGPS